MIEILNINKKLFKLIDIFLLIKELKRDQNIPVYEYLYFF